MYHPDYYFGFANKQNHLLQNAKHSIILLHISKNLEFLLRNEVMVGLKFSAISFFDCSIISLLTFLEILFFAKKVLNSSRIGLSTLYVKAQLLFPVTL